MSAKESNGGFQTRGKQLAVDLGQWLALDMQIHVVVVGVLVGKSLPTQWTNEGF